MHKYVIAYFFKPLEDLTEYQSTKSPLHITLLPIFGLPKKELNKLFNKLNSVANHSASFYVFGEGTALFGPCNDIPVIKVARSLEILNLHLKLLESIDLLNPIYDFPHFMRENFNPHSTIESNSQIKIGKKIIIDSFTLLYGGLNDSGVVKVIRTFNIN
jgi:2'-5' RNA ligase